MEIRELKERLSDITVLGFDCFDIHCKECVFHNLLEESCEGKKVDYDWNKIKELDLPDDIVVTKELLKDFKHKT